MKTTRIGSPPQAETSLWPVARRVGSIIAYAGVPASTLSSASGLLTTVNVQTSFYLMAVFGVVAVFRGAKIQPSLVTLSYVLLGWYVALAQAMRTLWGDEVRAQRMGQASRTRAATLFSAEKMADDYVALYEMLLRGNAI